MAANFVFLLHAVLAFVLAFVLIFFTVPFTEAVVETFVWPTGPNVGLMPKIIFAYAYLTAAGLILIAVSAGIAIISGYSQVRWATLIAMVAVSVAFILVSLLIEVSPLNQGVFWVNVVFVLLYVLVIFFRRKSV